MAVIYRKKINTCCKVKSIPKEEIGESSLAERMTGLFLLFIFLAVVLFVLLLSIGAGYMSYLAWGNDKLLSLLLGIGCLFLLGVAGAIVFAPFTCSNEDIEDDESDND